MEPAKGEESSGARACFKRKPSRIRAWRRRRLGRIHRVCRRLDTEETSAMLYQKVGEIFLENRPVAERAAFSDSLGCFHVPDVGTEDRKELRVVLLVESPHTAEVIDRYPLAGDDENQSGRIVSNKFMGWYSRLGPLDEPIGKLVHNRDIGNNPSINWLGIMNVSQLPFVADRETGEGAYEVLEDAVCRDDERWDDYIKCMKHIKKYPYSRNYKGVKTNGAIRLECEVNRLQREIAIDLAERLRPLGENVRLVCCGHVAQAFFFKTTCRLESSRYILGLPHPSINGWENIEPACSRRMREILACIQPPPD